MSCAVFLVIVSIFIRHSMSHQYITGSCAYVEPIPDFDMTKFLGVWYAMQKTTTESSCLIYNFKEGSKPGEYLLEQTSERYPTSFNISYMFDYTGKIKADKNSSQMTIHFPLNIAGSASFDVVTTDYNTFAGIYTCQNLLFFKRQSATLLSRTNKIDEESLKKMRHILDEHIGDLELDTIRHESCNEAGSQIQLKVKSNLASSIKFPRTIPTVPAVPGITDLSKKEDRHIADVSYDVVHISDDENSKENSIEPRSLNDTEDILWMK